MTVYLGIDYGRKHIGIAVADGPLARPLTSLEVGVKTDVIGEIARLVSANEVKQIVLGLPEGKLDAEIHAFGDKLAERTSLPVIYHPETLSTQEALAALRSSGASLAKRQHEHVYAACLILEDYLSSVEN